MTKRKFLMPVLAALALGVSACGGSSKAPGVALAPSAGLTADTSTAASASSSSGSSTAASATTPKPPSPLSKKPVVNVPSGAAPKGLVTKDLIAGTGAAAKSGSTVTVNYVGVLYKGDKEFDASWNRKQTFTTPLSTSSVIPGWVQGISGMKVGGRRELIIPPALGYGAAGSGSAIPPNSTLVFVVDLLGVN
jgi:peptidylprolyl isomerase